MPKYVAAISDADILIHLLKANHLDFLYHIFECIYIPEYVYFKELKRRAGGLFFKLEEIINQPDSKFKLIKESDMELLEKKVKKLTLDNIGDSVGRGEAECAAISKAKDIQIIISDNCTEFRFLSEFIMLTYYDLLSVCVKLEIMSIEEATVIYNDVNSIMDKKSSHDFDIKFTRSIRRINENGWNKVLF